MAKTTFFASNSAFEKEFSRCCNQYHTLAMYVAWIGNPKAVVPFEYLYNLSEITAIIGISFCQTHPDGIQLLMDLNADLRIAKEEILYHPKLYIFSGQATKAIFIGSSNFTYQGYFKNHEVNILIEGATNEMIFTEIENGIKKYKTQEFSFVPDSKWLIKYSAQYTKRRQKIKESGLLDEVEEDEVASESAAWLSTADWGVYIKKVHNGLKNNSHPFSKGLERKLELFKEYSVELSLPWKVSYFKSLPKRRMMGGIKEYGWLGHVAASGYVRKLFANGGEKEHKIIVDSINQISQMQIPMDWGLLNSELKNLIELGPSMKVWGRLLAIVRPDLFCTISSPFVRKKIAHVLEIPEKSFETVGGYIRLLTLIYASPWFNSPSPRNKNDQEIWKRRVAFLDVVFYVQ